MVPVPGGLLLFSKAGQTRGRVIRFVDQKGSTVVSPP